MTSRPRLAMVLALRGLDADQPCRRRNSPLSCRFANDLSESLDQGPVAVFEPVERDAQRLDVDDWDPGEVGPAVVGDHGGGADVARDAELIERAATALAEELRELSEDALRQSGSPLRPIDGMDVQRQAVHAPRWRRAA